MLCPVCDTICLLQPMKRDNRLVQASNRRPHAALCPGLGIREVKDAREENALLARGSVRASEMLAAYRDALAQIHGMADAEEPISVASGRIALEALNA